MTTTTDDITVEGAAASTTTDATGVQIAAMAKRYPDGTLALDGIDLQIAEGEFICIIGASGCGKSTLLRIMAGFEAHTGGSVAVRGSEVRGPGPDRGVVFQDYGLFPWLSVRSNIAYGPRQQGLPAEEVQARVERYLDLVQLTEFGDRFPSQLSGGMQQRVAIARVLANDPAVLLMDEPFGALDSLTRETLQSTLLGIWEEVASTVVFITHSVEEAVNLSNRVVVMSGGPNHGCPGYIKEVVDIDLPYPRDVTSPAFNDIKRHLIATVHGGVDHP